MLSIDAQHARRRLSADRAFSVELVKDRTARAHTAVVARRKGHFALLDLAHHARSALVLLIGRAGNVLVLIPLALVFDSVGTGKRALSMYLVLIELALVFVSVGIGKRALSMLLVLIELALVFVSVGSNNRALPMLLA